MNIQNINQHGGIEKSELRKSLESSFLTEKKLRFIAAWAGNLVAAARDAGYKDPRNAAYKLMKDPVVVAALQKKQESMLQQSGEQLARTIPLSRADVIDRLWQLAQLSPERTNHNINGQVKAAQALTDVFALDIDHNPALRRQLEGKTEVEIEFFAVHGFFPHSEQPPTINPQPELPPASETGDGVTEITEYRNEAPPKLPPASEPATTDAANEAVQANQSA